MRRFLELQFVSIQSGETFLGIPQIWIGALAGAFAVLVLVSGGSFRQRQISASSLLLTGIAISSICAALLAVGERWAASRGVRVGALLAQGYVLGSILVAGAMALTGLIGFVGLIVPHLVRSRISPDQRILMSCAFLLGGALLALCEALGRIVTPPAELPADAVLALIGGHYLVWIIRQRTPAEEI